MKIIYDHQAVSLYRYGGISRYFYEIANRIGAISGNQVEIFSPLYVNEYFQAGGKVRPRGWHVPVIPRTLRLIRALDNFASLTLKMRRDVDIFHETYYSPFDFCPPGAKRILTVYDMIHERLPAYFSSDDVTPRLKAEAVRRADHIICISESTRRDMLALLHIPEHRTSVVHLGYALTAKPGFVKPDTGNRPYLLYVGHRNAFRNSARLMRAYASSPALRNGYSLVFFGGGALTTSEQEMLRELSLTAADVRQISGGDDLLATLYSGAAAFVYPSLYEGFGIPPLEAMSFGCPVVCGNTSSLPEVVGDAAELFDPADEGALRAALERVVTSSERAAQLVVLGHQRCKQFSWEKCAQETLAVYERVLQG